MKKAVLVIAVALMAVAMLATPVMAIGPWEAVDSNPNLGVLRGVLTLPHEDGPTIRWHDDSSVVGDNIYKGRDITMYRPATKADVDGEIKNAAIALMEWDGPPTYPATNIFTGRLGTDNALALEYENKWIYMSNAYVLKFFGPEGPAFAALWPYGVYYKYVNIG